MFGRPSEQTILDQFNLKKGWMFLDAGAHIGWYTLIMSRRVGPEGKVLVVEPNAANFAVLSRNIKDNKLSNVLAFQVALSDKDGYAQMVLADSPTQHSIIDNPEDAKLETVKTMRLDTLLEEAGVECLDFAKVDVEGAEMQFLQGASKTLEHRPEMVIESENIEVDEFLRNLNYEVRWVDEMNLHAKMKL